MTNRTINLKEAADIVRYECGAWTGLAETIIRRLKEMPTVDAVPVVHGRWILKKADSGFHTDCVCSECKRRFAIGWNYCPNCGARMDGKDGEAHGTK